MRKYNTLLQAMESRPQIALLMSSVNSKNDDNGDGDVRTLMMSVMMHGVTQPNVNIVLKRLYIALITAINSWVITKSHTQLP